MADNPAGVEIMAPPGMEEMTNQLQNLFSGMSRGKKKTRKLKVAEALKLIRDEEAVRLVNEEELKARAPWRRSSSTASSSSTRSTRSPSAPTPAAPTSPARAYSATCCR